MPEIALEPRPGDSLGPYRITRVIGRGRMGIVFEVTADGEDPVAVKVVTTDIMTSNGVIHVIDAVLVPPEG
jgi:serine/threonine-protein kinase